VNSIRRRTSVLVAASIAGLLSLGGLGMFLVVRASLAQQFDDGLLARAAALQSLTDAKAGKIEMDKTGAVMPWYHQGGDAEYFVAWVRDRDHWRVLAQSESLGANVWSEAGSSPRRVGVADCALPDGRAGRSLTAEFTPEIDPEADGEPNTSVRTTSPGDDLADTSVNVLTDVPVVRLVVAQSTAPLDRTLATIALSIVGVGGVLVLASIAATQWAVRRGTRPLVTLSASVATLGPDTLERRLDLGHLPSELAPVAGRLNDLLARLDDAFARERRFTSAASHELRTPIAELRMLLEVGLSRERTPERWEQTARDGLGVLDRAQRLTEALLRLSRASEGSQAALPDATIDLSAVLREQAARALDASGHDPSHVSIDAPRPLPARIDPALAASIIGNLIENALRHGDVSTDRAVRCVGTSDAAGTSIVISNHAPTLTAADIKHLFEPFWRKDAGRDAPGGFGLGLSVSRALAASVGASLEYQLSADKDVQAILRFRRP